MKIAYFDCFSGISGDMAIAAFLDAGLKLSVLTSELEKLNLGGYQLKQSRVKRGTIAGTKFDCVKTKGYSGHRSLDSIVTLIAKSKLSPRVKKLSTDVFSNIGSAEARVHGVGKDEDVWLHELGDIDSIVDIVGIAIAIDSLGIDSVYSSEVNMGRTFVKSSHGALPVPGPAALELLRGVSVKIIDVDAELVTPTGAGILKTFSKGFGAIPAMNIASIGYGAGTREIKDIPNMLRVIIGSSVARTHKEDDILVVETNIDDMNPQYYEYVFERLFSQGALDVYSTVIQMKKARSAIKLTVLCAQKDLEKISAVIFKETTSIGIRYYSSGRFTLERKTVKVKTKYGNVRVKVSARPGGVSTAMPEYDDCRRIAHDMALPLGEVYDKAMEAVREDL